MVRVLVRGTVRRYASRVRGMVRGTVRRYASMVRVLVRGRYALRVRVLCMWGVALGARACVLV